MSTVISCPTCLRKLRLPEDLIGREVQCLGCQATFAAATPTAVPPPAPVYRPDEPPASRPPSPEDDAGPVRCPDCGAVVPESTARCLSCGCEFAAGTEFDYRPWERDGNQPRDCEPHRASLIMGLGIGGLAGVMLCFPVGILGIVAWVMGSRDLRAMREGRMDRAGQGGTQAGWICGIIATCLLALIACFYGLYMVFIVGLIAAGP